MRNAAPAGNVPVREMVIVIITLLASQRSMVS